MITAAEAGVETHYATFPRDYMRFTEAGEFSYFGSQVRIPERAAIEASLARADEVDGVTYTAEVRPDGALIIYRDGHAWQGFTCAVIADARPIAQHRPAMLWTHLKQMPPLRRLQLKIK